MTERSHAVCHRDQDHFQIGPSSLSCNDEGLVWKIDEIANPIPRRLQGEVFVHMGKAWQSDVFSLTADASHRWGPLQPRARIKVRFERPALQWEGWAYVDANEGDEPINQGFSDWDWSRAHLPDHSTAVLYDVRSPGMEPQSSNILALRFASGEKPEAFSPGVRQSLGRTAWGIHRHSFREGEKATRLEESLEDTPFYARSVIRATMLGHDVVAMHETLDARRFASPWVQSLLPWRMPRQA
ncbi:MAG: Acyclic carotenoid 1,2-hydratase, partial [Pseudomonadota bacterium]|jgi:carotenoid 1,2-hydratase